MWRLCRHPVHAERRDGQGPQGLGIVLVLKIVVVAKVLKEAFVVVLDEDKVEVPSGRL